MKDDLLLPCPFCGSSIVGVLLESSKSGDKLGVVGCGCCGASGPCFYDEEELIERWNHRAANLNS
jgi:Lar family restriction alleviation protein